MAPWPVSRERGRRRRPRARFASNARAGRRRRQPRWCRCPRSTASRRARLWVRNGLGQAAAAELDRGDAALASHGLARLKLRAAAAGRHLAPGRRVALPFAGSPGLRDAVRRGQRAGLADAHARLPRQARGRLRRAQARLRIDARRGRLRCARRAGRHHPRRRGRRGHVDAAAGRRAIARQAASGAAPAALPGLWRRTRSTRLGLRRALQVLVDLRAE